MREANVIGQIKCLYEGIVLQPKAQYVKKYTQTIVPTANDTSLDGIGLAAFNAIHMLNNSALELITMYQEARTVNGKLEGYMISISAPILVYYHPSHKELIKEIVKMSNNSSSTVYPELSYNFTFIESFYMDPCGAKVVDTSIVGKNGAGTDQDGFMALKPASASEAGKGVMLVLPNEKNIFGTNSPVEITSEIKLQAQATNFYSHHRVTARMWEHSKMHVYITAPKVND
jgi:hypothetical protein